MRRLIWCCALLIACDSGGPTDTDDVDTGTIDEGCPLVNIWVDGPDNPRVGDTWTVLLKCDQAVMLGPMILRFDPSEFVSISDNEVTFQSAGEAEMRVQVGSYVERMTVVVTD